VLLDADTARYWVDGSFALPQSGSTTVSVQFLPGSYAFLPATAFAPAAATALNGCSI